MEDISDEMDPDVLNFKIFELNGCSYRINFFSYYF